MLRVSLCISIDLISHDCICFLLSRYGFRAGKAVPPEGYRQKSGTCALEFEKIEEEHHEEESPEEDEQEAGDDGDKK